MIAGLRPHERLCHTRETHVESQMKRGTRCDLFKPFHTRILPATILCFQDSVILFHDCQQTLSVNSESLCLFPALPSRPFPGVFGDPCSCLCVPNCNEKRQICLFAIRLARTSCFFQSDLLLLFPLIGIERNKISYCFRCANVRCEGNFLFVMHRLI